jgi:hypothetical protein
MGVMINEDRFGIASASFNVVSCAAAAITEQSFTVAGLRPGDFCHLNAQSSGLGNVGIAGLRVSAANTLTVRFINPTAAPINPGTVPFLVFWFRPEKLLANIAAV